MGRTQITNGFWTGVGFALAVLVWSVLQMVLNRAKG